MIVATPGRLLDLVESGNSGYWSGVRAAIYNNISDTLWEDLHCASFKSELQPMTLRSGSSRHGYAHECCSLWHACLIGSVPSTRS